MYHVRKTWSHKDLLIIMSNLGVEQLLQSVGNGSVVHTEENLVRSTVAQADIDFTWTVCTGRALCCFLTLEGKGFTFSHL